MADKVYDKYVVDNSPTMGEGRIVDMPNAAPSQVRYAHEGMAPQRCDKTRFTKDDADAYAVNMQGELGEMNVDESQGGMY